MVRDVPIPTDTADMSPNAASALTSLARVENSSVTLTVATADTIVAPEGWGVMNTRVIWRAETCRIPHVPPSVDPVNPAVRLRFLPEGIVPLRFLPEVKQLSKRAGKSPPFLMFFSRARFL